MPSSMMIRRSAAVLAVGLSAALLTPAMALAAPVAPDAVTVTAPAQTPGNDALKAAIAALTKSAVDPAALAAAKALLSGTPQIESTPAAEITATPAADATDFAASLAAADAALEKLGIQSFINPSVAFNCVAPTEDNPFGLVPAVGGAAPGPYVIPGLKVPEFLKPFLPAGFSPELVGDGETLFGFVPAGITADGGGTGMQVAWFNIDTFKGGFVDMAPVGTTITDQLIKQVKKIRNLSPTEEATARAVISPLAKAFDLPGARLAPVATGNGTVLSAVFGTVQNGDRSCFFLPMIGITQV
ncbi:hypothetical protein [Nocardia sp. 348MFTsu5.1]|uniref:hypothetical protein n=1 Tax=Nocardia sp. 348MFTsu5.1 TaxID=1172185 RepID=UPI00048AEFBE|nr:hypothetical protein [Nocardia sp. 348MFTsu5.1]